MCGIQHAPLAKLQVFQLAIRVLVSLTGTVVPISTSSNLHCLHCAMVVAAVCFVCAVQSAIVGTLDIAFAYGGQVR
jgi:hypothetical protein